MILTQKALDTKLVDLKGDTFAIPFPTDKQVAKLPQKDGRPDTSKLPECTVRELILDALRNYPIESRKEAFKIQVLAQSVLDTSTESMELKENFSSLLQEVMDEAIMRTEDEEKVLPNNEKISQKVQHGMYKGYLVAQAYAALGIDIEKESEQE